MDHHCVRAIVAYFVLSIAAFPAATASAQAAPPAVNTPPPVTAPPAVNTPPPIKMGRWESTVTQTMTGFQLPPGMAEKLKAAGRPGPDAPRISAYETCLTTDQWNKNMAALQAPDKNCTRSNLIENPHRMSFDLVCAASGPSPAPATTTGHMEMIYETLEKTHGTMTMKGVPVGPQGAPVDMVIKMETRFLSSACGDLKPGENKPIVKK